MKNAAFTPSLALTPLAQIANRWRAVFAKGDPSRNPPPPSHSFVTAPELRRIKVAALTSYDHESTTHVAANLTANITVNVHPAKRPGLASRWKDPHRVPISQRLPTPVMPTMRQL